MGSPTSKRKEREREARRQAILDAAGRIFSRKGFHEATVDEIASEAELAKGTIYNYYKDKHDIFVSLMNRGYDQFLKQLAESVKTEESLHEFIRHVFEISFRIMMEHRYMLRVMMTASTYLPESSRSRRMIQWREHIHVICDNLAQALSRLPETRNLSEDERLTAAKMILGSVRFLFIVYLRDADPEIPHQEIENFTRLICRALKAEQTA